MLLLQVKAKKVILRGLCSVYLFLFSHNNFTPKTTILRIMVEVPEIYHMKSDFHSFFLVRDKQFGMRARLAWNMPVIYVTTKFALKTETWMNNSYALEL